MFAKGKKKRNHTARVDTLVGQRTEVAGDVTFSGGLHVDGTVRGNVTATEAPDSMLTVSENGRIEGDVRVAHNVLNGTVVGNVHAAARIELAAKARVNGDVYYNLIEMAMGAEVNGSLVHRSEQTPSGEAIGALREAPEREPPEREPHPGNT